MIYNFTIQDRLKFIMESQIMPSMIIQLVSGNHF